MQNSLSWQVAQITSLNKKTGAVGVYCQKLGKPIFGQLDELIRSNYNLYDSVRVYLNVLPYTVRILMIKPRKK